MSTRVPTTDDYSTPPNTIIVYVINQYLLFAEMHGILQLRTTMASK
jgi:hypothetical protein